MDPRFCPVCERRRVIVGDLTCRLCWRTAPRDLKKRYGEAVIYYRQAPSPESRVEFIAATRTLLEAIGVRAELLPVVPTLPTTPTTRTA